MRVAVIGLCGLLLAGCYQNARTIVERNGFMAVQSFTGGHGWTERGREILTQCPWDTLQTHPMDHKDYCPAEGHGTKTVTAQTFDAQSDRIIPAVIHGMAFMAGTLGGAAILGSLIPSSTITQVNGGTFGPIRTSTLVLPGGPVPGGVAK